MFGGLLGSSKGSKEFQGVSRDPEGSYGTLTGSKIGN